MTQKCLERLKMMVISNINLPYVLDQYVKLSEKYHVIKFLEM